MSNLESKTWIVLGCGRSLTEGAVPNPIAETVIACNRAIESYPADYWIWVDRLHFERSKSHTNALRARWLGPQEHALAYGRSDMYLFRAVNRPDEDGLFLHGGTLTVAAHFALRKGARRIIFVGCDGWREDQDRYHFWDGKALDERGINEHGNHLRKTAEGIAMLRQAYPQVEFLDATPENRYLGCKCFELEKLRDHSMAKENVAGILRDPGVPAGYGRLVSVTPLCAGDVVMWYEDACGTVRGLRMACDTSNGLALVPKGQAVVERT